MKHVLLASLFALGTTAAHAADEQQVDKELSPWVTSSLQAGNAGFDSWTLTTGYHYPLMEQVNVFVATEVTLAAKDSASRGLLSGIEYNFGDILSIKGEVQAQKENSSTEGIIGMSTQLSITEDMNLEAALDYAFTEDADNTTQYKLGVGVKF
ncbi:hypothetical protein CS022_07090 [Veronia nyctiphanis]|uniref:Outer membrane protein beta-barrel domain-containing protein n=1 Tax=Veronia nyctiphanis TaxID=1278244 RepID=A0A4Q0YX00_9GAMM|nr:hypothetical protein [Veronia nyctiphanis]RXJ73769.1 hypothetical protein CS022_07090 [Veronia nyctiphanis]